MTKSAPLLMFLKSRSYVNMELINCLAVEPPNTSDKDRSNGEHSNEDENEDSKDRLHTNTVYVDRRSRRRRGNRYHVMLSNFVVSLKDQVLDMPNQSRLLIIQRFTPKRHVIYFSLVSVLSYQSPLEKGWEYYTTFTWKLKFTL